MAFLYYPPKIQNADLHPAYMEFKFFERKDPKGDTLSDTIYLYMPERASQPSTVSWETEKFGIIGESIAGAAGNPWSVGGAFDGAMKLGEAGAARGMSNLLAAAANALGGSVSAQGILGESTGKISNPYLTMVFRGVDFRNFQYNFKFFPFQESDCDMIDKIIKTFRGNSLPPGDIGAPLLKYPKEVAIAYKWRGENNKWLNNFKKAVITGIDVDYTPNGMFSVMRNGFPSCIEMNVKFSEIEIVLRKDVMEGGY